MKTIKHESNALIRFPDCDPFNHLNNARYLDYFFNAREDHIANHHDITLAEITKRTGKCWVVVESQIKYLKPAVWTEEVILTSQLIQWKDKYPTVEMQMWNKEKTQLKSIMWSSFIHFDLKTNLPAEHDPEIIEIFGITGEQMISINIDQRIKEILSA